MSTNKETVNEVVLQGKIKDVFYKDNVTVLSKINYTLKKIDTEGGQDKFILVFYNKNLTKFKNSFFNLSSSAIISFNLQIFDSNSRFLSPTINPTVGFSAHCT